MYINLEFTPLNRRHPDEEMERIQGDIRFFHELRLHNRKLAKDRVAEYRERKMLEAQEVPLWG